MCINALQFFLSWLLFFRRLESEAYFRPIKLDSFFPDKNCHMLPTSDRNHSRNLLLQPSQSATRLVFLKLKMESYFALVHSTFGKCVPIDIRASLLYPNVTDHPWNVD